MYIPKRVRLVKLKEKGKSLFANQDFKKGEVIFKFKGEIKSYKELIPEESEYALQIDDDKFIDSRYYVVSDYINHSCDANLRVDLKNLSFVALRNIKKKEEITYNYLTTEYDLARDNLDFECKCNSKDCLGRIKGFKFLTKLQKLKLKPSLAPFLKKRI